MRNFFILSMFAIAIVFMGSHPASLASSPVRKKTVEGDFAARPGYILVRKKPGLPDNALLPVHDSAETLPVKAFAYVPGLELVKTKPGVTVEEALSIYLQDPTVEYAEPDYLYYTQTIPNDPRFLEQWGLHNVGQVDGRRNADINAPEAWNMELGSRSYALGIMDSGVDYRHPDLVRNLWMNPGEIPENGIDDDRNGYVDDIYGINVIRGTGNPMDDNMHGTHVAGIIGAEGNNGIGGTGVMQNASLISCKFLQGDGSGALSDALECIRYFNHLKTRRPNPVDIVAVNISWGGGPYSNALYDAIKQSRETGILFVMAASNGGGNSDVLAPYPSNFDLNNVISVAAFDSSYQITDFSNYGRYSVHVAAPGVDILSTVPGGRYAELSGTSAAAPFVTGLAGLIKSSHPEYSWAQIKNLIISSGRPNASAKEKTVSGRSILAAGLNGEGALTCMNQRVTTRLTPKGNATVLRLGNALQFSILSIDCEGANSEPAVLVEGNSSGMSQNQISINDRGLDRDIYPNDGVYTGTFMPTAVGTYEIQFPNEDVISVRVRN